MLTTERGCELEVERGPDWLLVRVKGLHPGMKEPPPIADIVWSLAEQHFTYRVVLELDGVNLLDSHLLGQFVVLYRRIRRRDGILRLCGLSAYNREVLQTCRLDDWLAPYADRQEAIMAGLRSVRPR